MKVSESRRRRTAALAGIILVLGGCAVAVPSRTTPRQVARTNVDTARPTTGAKPLISDGASGIMPAAVSGDESPVQPAPGPLATVISDRGSGIVGQVRAPASLISNNAGGVLANHGGAIVSDAGSAYRLLADDEVVVAGVPVRLVQADGTPVLSKDGQPITALTDAAGRYRLPVWANGGNLIIQVGAAGGEGHLLAMVPRGESETDRTVDVNLVSTLVMGYILDRYLKDQTDRQVTLDKLPAAVEAQTRTLAQEAFNAGHIAVPPSLEASQVVKAVDALRARDTGFDVQMETVKRLLIAAGLSDLGNGKAATQVPLTRIGDVVTLGGGEVFFICPDDNRVWRLGIDGRLYTAVGRGGVTPEDELNGKQGADVSIYRPVAIAADGDGLLVLEAKRLSRRAADGTMTVLTTEISNAGGFWKTGTGTIHVLERGEVARSRPSRIMAIARGQAPALVHTFNLAETKLLNGLVRVAVVEPGVVALGLVQGEFIKTAKPVVTAAQFASMYIRTPSIYHLTLSSFALAPAVVGDPAILQSLTMDERGTPIRRRKGVRELDIGPAGESKLSLPDSFDGTSILNFQAVVHEGDTGLLLIDYDKVHRVVSGGKTASAIVAGVLEPPRAGRADEIVLFESTALAVTRAGKLFAFDAHNGWFWEIGADENARVISQASPNSASGGDFLVEPIFMRIDASDRLVFLDQTNEDNKTRLIWLDQAGKFSTLFEADGESAELILDFFSRPEGGFYVLVDRNDAGRTVQYLLEIDANGVRKAQHELSEDETIQHLAVTPSGKVYMVGDSRLLEWTAASGLKEREVSQDWQDAYDPAAWLTVDLQGRLISSNFTGIRRLDPMSGQTKDLVGYEGHQFQGKGVDDGTGSEVLAPCVDGKGDLYFLDPENRQIKRVPATKIP